jgi:DNA-directed RNA polymerase specialized sigma24 family protein
MYYSETALVDLIRQKDNDACIYLYEKYAGAFQVLIRQVMQDTGDTEEALKKTFVNICNSIDEFDPRKSRLFTWMLNTARLTAIAELRSAKFFKSTPVHIPVYTETQGLGRLITRLSTEEKQLIGLLYFKGYSTEDVARHLNLPAEITRKKIRNALVQLKTLL